jgi:hypothetical protein
MNLELKKRIAGAFLMYGIMASGYGFMMKAEGSATSTLKLIFSISGGASLIGALVMQTQLNKSDPPSSK